MHRNTKNIIICCDGTGNQYGTNNTNVIKIYEMLDYGDDFQKVFYDPGVGTSSSALTKYLKKISTLLSQAFGLDLHKNVEDAYYYLMNVYQEGDQVFLFGFSRGAHTVRRLASMLEKCGLLLRGSENMIPYASRMYLEEMDPKIAQGFKETFSRSCPVHFIGVWDTVSAVSSLLPRPKLDGIMSQEVQYSYHAVAIDERRLQFPPNLWIEEHAKANQTVEQVWFAGVHSDVGGSYKEQGLSNIALHWLLKKAIDAGLKILPGSLERIKINPLDQQHESWSGRWWFIPYHVYVFLFLVLVVLVELFVVFLNHWWTIPIHPVSFVADILSVYGFYLIIVLVALIPFNKKNRVLPKNARVHLSVKTRLSNQELKYNPKNLAEVIETVQWVE